NPAMMVKVIVYSYCIGCRSSRKIAKALYEDVAFRVLAANNFPDFRTISDFRKIHLSAVEGMFDHVLNLCDEAGLVKLGTVAIDGTKVKANASIDKNYTHETLERKERQIQEITRKIFEEAERIDKEEDRIYGKDKRGDELPEGFRTHKEQLERIREARERIEKKQRKKKEEYDAKVEARANKEAKSGKKLRGRKLKKVDDKFDDSDKANTTDPDSQIMKARHGYIQGFNAQIVVDCDSQVIVATHLTQDHNDLYQLSPMMKQTISNTGRKPKHATLDAGYDYEDQMKEFANEIDLYIPSQKGWKQRKAMRDQPPPRGRIPNDMTFRERMNRKLLTKKGKKIYKKRAVVEAVNGQIKSARGIDRLLLRGKEKGNGEWNLICTTHNILKLWRKKAING
ncbi:MAG: DDE transposase, partial [Firmicutes bacterium HGW-Firmicutes-13]